MLAPDGKTTFPAGVVLDYTIGGRPVQIAENLDANPTGQFKVSTKPAAPGTAVTRTEEIDGNSYLVLRTSDLTRVLMIRWETTTNVIVTVSAIPGGLDDATAKALVRHMTA